MFPVHLAGQCPQANCEVLCYFSVVIAIIAATPQVQNSVI